MRTEKIMLKGRAFARRAIELMLARSAWFQLTPFPDGEYELAVKEGEGHLQTIQAAVADEESSVVPLLCVGRKGDGVPTFEKIQVLASDADGATDPFARGKSVMSLKYRSWEGMCFFEDEVPEWLWAQRPVKGWNPEMTSQALHFLGKALELCTNRHPGPGEAVGALLALRDIHHRLKQQFLESQPGELT